MADIIESATQEAQTQETISAEIKQQMAFSMGDFSSLQNNQQAEGQEGQQQSQSQDQSQSQGTEQTQTQPAATVDIFAPFKEKFGYEKPEDAIAEIETLRHFKANPVREELKFENDESKKLFEAIKAGKRAEVTAILSQQERLNSITSTEVTDDNAADLIKLAMQVEYKDLTQAEIDYKYNKQFAIPKEPVQKADEEDDDFSNRKAAWEEQVRDIKMSKIIEAKLAKPKLEAAKSNLVLPDIEQPQADEGYVQYQKALEKQTQLADETKVAYSKFAPKDIGMKLNFKDEPNKIDFNFDYEPDAESFKAVAEAVSDSDKFYALFQKSDGTSDRQKFLEAIYFGLNKDKILTEAMKQAKNAAIKASLPDNSGGQRHIPATHEPTELDQQMRMSMAV